MQIREFLIILDVLDSTKATHESVQGLLTRNNGNGKISD